MRILVLGGDGMLGHQLLKTLQLNHQVKVTLRQDATSYRHYNLFNSENSYAGVDVRRVDDLVSVISEWQPEAIINAVGIVKQRKSAKESIPSIEINALFPHRLAQLAKAVNARVIHLSTDCVFDGSKGNYTQDDLSDAEDIYGKTKYLGELHENHCVTIRSSIIGLELARKTSLIEWFLAQEGTVKGFKNAIYTGLTTLEMSRVIEHILLRHIDLSGVWQVASAPINKFDLLTIFTKFLNKNIYIEADEKFKCDRSLLSDQFNKTTNYSAPTWESMLSELANQVRERG